jgi:ribonuclease R
MTNYYEYNSSDLCNRPLIYGITIDEPATKIMDDAILIERQNGLPVICVSIADVSYLVPPNTEIDQIAYERGFTDHNAGESVPMLPSNLTQERLSLVPQLARPALTVIINLDSKFEIEKTTIIRTRVMSLAKWDYQDFTDAVEGGNPKSAEWFEVSLELLNKRRQRGASFSYELPNDPIADVTEEISFPKQFKSYRSKGKIFVRELMILANRAVAEYANKHRIPLLYNNNWDTRLTAEERSLLGRQLEMGIFGYSPDSMGHCGLNLPHYCHFTSPMRRFADLINHRQIIAHIENKPFLYDRADLLRLSTHLNARYIEIEEKDPNSLRDLAVQAALSTCLRLTQRLTIKLAKKIVTDTLAILKEQPEVGDVFHKSAFQLNADKKISIEGIFLILAKSPRNSEGWAKLRRVVLEYMSIEESYGASTINYAGQKYPEEWSDISYSYSQSSGGFCCVLTLTLDNNFIRIESPVRPGKKAAKNAVANTFWEYLCNGTIEQCYVHVPQAAAVEISGNKRRISPNNDRAISVFYEFCDATRLTKPTVDYKVEEGSGSLSYVCSLGIEISSFRPNLGSGPIEIFTNQMIGDSL